jgi:hypothetical protein
MMEKAFRVLTVASLLIFGLLSEASASPPDVVWHLSGTFSDGGTLAGSFAANSVTGTITSWNITTTAGSIRSGFHYDSSLTGAQVVEPDGPWDVTFRNNVPTFSHPALVFDFVGLTSPSGFATLATYAISTSSFECDNCGAYRSIASGSVTTVPEPESYAMMLAGLGLMGFLARRRKREEAA